MLRYVVLSGPGGEKEVPILYDKTFILKDSEWSGFVAIIDGLNFWTASTPQRRHGLDGDIWVLEGLCADRYHVIERSFLDVQSGDDVYLYRLFRFLLRRVVWEDGGARETKGTSLKS